MRTASKNAMKSATRLAVLLIAVALSTTTVLKFFGKQIAISAYRFSFGSGKEVNVDYFAVPDEGEDSAPETVEQTQSEAPAQIPAVSSVAQGDPDAVAVNLSVTSGKYKVFNGTSVINNTKFDVSELLNADYERPAPNKDEPFILIYHTHTSESYYGGGSVIDVGNAMAEEFERLGYKTVHITEYYDKEHFSGAYSRSIKGVEQALKQYPSIKLCFDVHRDSITGSDGVDYRPVTEIGGSTSAQVMLVCGTDAKGLEHPRWRENFKFALDISRTMSGRFPSLSRPVNLRADRFNTHVTDYSVLIEVGSDANTVDEARLAGVCTAQSVVETIENNK